MKDKFAENRKRKALAMTLAKRSGSPRDPSMKGATGVPQAFNRNMKASDVAAGQESRANPTRTIDKKTKIQYGQAY